MLLKYLGEEGAFLAPAGSRHDLRAPLDLQRPASTCGGRAIGSTTATYWPISRRRRGRGRQAVDEEREIVRAARSVREYDDRFISPRYGFRGADDYYDLCTPLSYMPEIRVPTLVWRRATTRGFPPATIATSMVPTIRRSCGDGGGRRSSRLPSADSDRPWCDTVLEKFLERV